MPKAKIVDGRKSYFCEECHMIYNDHKIADECESWCKKHKSCNLEIIKSALKIRSVK